MKKLLLTLSIACTVLGMALAPIDADAKRLGGGRPAGMQRQMPAQPANAAPHAPAAPAQNNAAAPANSPAAVPPAAAPAGKRSWLGPLAGLAAGLGIAALASHFGFGEALSNMMMMGLLAVAAVFVIGWLMRRFGPGKNQSNSGLAMAGASAGSSQAPAWSAPSPAAAPAANPVWQRNEFTAAPVGAGADLSHPGLPAVTPSASNVTSLTLPPNFDAAAFDRIAKMIFIRMQAANDAGQIEDLRKFTTPELFASLRMDLMERGQQPQHTDVQELHAEVLDTARQNDQWLITVRFHGRIVEDAQTGVQPFDELWHLVQPVDGSRDWAIAGIQQRQ
ncbi:MAG: Tim44 domain-containing protein [Leptothrix sp. (in: b-proteobacteria)]